MAVLRRVVDERERPLLLRARPFVEPPREPATERLADVDAAFAPERAPVAAAFVARRAVVVALRAVLRADVVRLVDPERDRADVVRLRPAVLRERLRVDRLRPDCAR